MAFAELREPTIAVKTLVLVAVLHEAGDFCPLLGIGLVELQELVVLLAGPGFDLTLLDVLVFLADFHVDVLALFGQQAYHELPLHSSIN